MQLAEIKHEEGREQGRIEAKTEMVKRLLADKFSAKNIASYAAVSVAFVEKVKKTMK